MGFGTPAEISLTIDPNTLILDSSSGVIIAKAGANYVNVGGLPVMVNEMNIIGGSASAGDAIQLPSGQPGLSFEICNLSGAEIAVFAGGSNDTINGQAAGAYVTLQSNASALFYCSEVLAGVAAWQCPGVAQGFAGNFATVNSKDAISAAGATQGAATPLIRSVNRVTAVASGSGVILPATIGALLGGGCLMVTVINAQNTNALKVYPNTGEQIEAGGANAAYSVPAATSGQGGKVAQFLCVTAGQWHVMLSSN